MTIKQERITGLVGGKFVADDQSAGLLVWSKDLFELTNAISLVCSKGEIFIGSDYLTAALSACPTLAPTVLAQNSQLRLLVGKEPSTQIEELRLSERTKLAADIITSVRNGGFVIRDALATRWVNWLSLPNTDRGGH